MNTKESLDFLASLEFFGIKLGLDQTRELFRRVGNPEKHLRFIHVAGSNGKGSVCALTEAALRCAGFKTGFYSSPHLVEVGERFRINGVPCSAERLAGLIERIRPHLAKMAENGMKATYFEVTTALAAMLFAEEKVDFVLWETGMGGRLDSTNIVMPELCAITGISLEHQDRLGGTLEAIAFEKAGIIKENIPLFCAEQTPPPALGVIRRRAQELHAPLAMSEGIVDEMTPSSLRLTDDRSRAVQTFRLSSGDTLNVALQGRHQRHNAALAYPIVRHLSVKFGFDFQKAVAGFETAQWDARFQLFPERNLILDAAHNPEGAEALAGTLRELFPGQRFNFIFGAFSDKDSRRGLELLSPLAESFAFVHLHSSRASRNAAELTAYLADIAPDISCREADLEEALLAPVSGKAEWKVLCGSLHLCGEALGILAKI